MGMVPCRRDGRQRAITARRAFCALGRPDPVGDRAILAGLDRPRGAAHGARRLRSGSRDGLGSPARRPLRRGGERDVGPPRRLEGPTLRRARGSVAGRAAPARCRRGLRHASRGRRHAHRGAALPGLDGAGARGGRQGALPEPPGLPLRLQGQHGLRDRPRGLPGRLACRDQLGPRPVAPALAARTRARPQRAARGLQRLQAAAEPHPRLRTALQGGAFPALAPRGGRGPRRPGAALRRAHRGDGRGGLGHHTDPRHRRAGFLRCLGHAGDGRWAAVEVWLRARRERARRPRQPLRLRAGRPGRGGHSNRRCPAPAPAHAARHGRRGADDAHLRNGRRPRAGRLGLFDTTPGAPDALRAQHGRRRAPPSARTTITAACWPGSSRRCARRPRPKASCRPT